VLDRLIRWMSGESGDIIRSMEDLRPGKSILEGRLRGEETLLAPTSHIPCLAFYYRATYLAASRVKKSVRRRLRDALCFAPEMRLELQGGSVLLVRKSSDSFSPEQHEALKSMDVEGFKAREDRVVANTPVRVVGRLRKPSGNSGEWQMEFQEIVPLSGEESQPPPKVDRKSARANRKKLRSRKGK
jgi:hypothetical protein